MFDHRRLRQLKRKKNRFQEQHELLIDESEYLGLFDVEKIGQGQREIVAEEYWAYVRGIRELESKILRKAVQKYDIELKPGCLEIAYSTKGKPFHYFTDEAVLSVKEAIKQREKEKRENIEWWVAKVIVPTLGALTGLIGVLLAVWAINKK